MAEQWLDRLKAKCEETIVAYSDMLAEELTTHSQDCPAYVTVEATLAICGYTPGSFMEAWISHTLFELREPE